MALKGLLLRLGVFMLQSRKEVYIAPCVFTEPKERGLGASSILAFQTGVEQPPVSPG